MRLVPGCGRFQDVSDSRRGQCCRMWKVLFFGTRQNWAVSRIWARRRRNRSRSSHFQGCSSFHDLAVSSMWHFPGCGAPQDFVFSGCRILQPVVISRICSLTEFGLFQDLALPSMRAARRRKGIQDASVAFSRMWHFPGPGSFQDLAFSRMWHSPVCGILQDVTLPRMCYPVLSRAIPCYPAGRDHLQHAFCPRMWPSPGPAFAPLGRAPTEEIRFPGCGILQDLFCHGLSISHFQDVASDKAPTNKIYRRASSEQHPRTRSCHESERLV